VVHSTDAPPSALRGSTSVIAATSSNAGWDGILFNFNLFVIFSTKRSAIPACAREVGEAAGEWSPPPCARECLLIPIGQSYPCRKLLLQPGSSVASLKSAHFLGFLVEKMDFWKIFLAIEPSGLRLLNSVILEFWVGDGRRLDWSFNY
jgi:hypothetical protein